MRRQVICFVSYTSSLSDERSWSRRSRELQKKMHSTSFLQSPRSTALLRSSPAIASSSSSNVYATSLAIPIQWRKKSSLAKNLVQIRHRRAGKTMMFVQDPASMSNLWRWAKEKGVSAPAVELATVEEGLGLVAKKDLSRNELVLEVPKRVWISSDAVAADPEMRRFCGGLRPWVSLALFILRERAKGAESFWKPYLDILPASTDSPLFWSEEQLSELQGTQLLNTVQGVKDFLRSEFLKVEEEILLPYKSVFPSPITFEDFVWAFGIIRSRTLSGLSGENLTLIPVADFVNHSPKITSKDSPWEIKGKGLFSREEIFSLRTTVPIKVGEQVFIQYDLGKSNAELALDYGFIERTPDRDSYTLTLGIPESEEFLDDKLDIAESNGLGETSYFDIYLDQSLPPLMIPYLRLLALGGSDCFLLEALFRNSVWGHLELPVSYQNEGQICRVIRDACRSALSGYQTTIEEDESILEAGSLDKRLEIAVWIRKGEKKVLKQIDMGFEEREKELDVLEYYQERRLKDLGLVGEQGEIIFWEK
ncbi:rubisco methyltransferase family protein [Wolffia australiana]